MSEGIEFKVYAKAEPQGSSKAFVIGGKARITSANKKMLPFRQEVTRTALYELAQQNLPQPLFPRGLPVTLTVQCYFVRPPSVKKSRLYPAVKPDVDKLARCILDSLTGVAYHDDAQVVELNVHKMYDTKDWVLIEVRGT